MCRAVDEMNDRTNGCRPSCNKPLDSLYNDGRIVELTGKEDV